MELISDQLINVHWRYLVVRNPVAAAARLCSLRSPVVGLFSSNCCSITLKNQNIACFKSHPTVSSRSSLLAGKWHRLQWRTWKWTFVTLSESAPRSGLEAHRLLLASRVSIYLISHVNHKRNSLPIQLWGPNLVYMVADFPNSIGEIERALFNFSWMKRHILGVGYWEHSSIQFYSLTPCDHAILWGQEFSIRIAPSTSVIKTPWLKNSAERSECSSQLLLPMQYEKFFVFYTPNPPNISL